MREETIKLYQIDELPPEQQKKICDNYRDINVSHDDWFFYDSFISKAESEGFEVAEKNIRCYGLHSQGDGASFSCRVNILKFIDSIDKDGTKYPRTREKYKEGDYEINIITSNSNYSHSYTMQVDIRDNIQEEKEDLKDSIGSVLEGKDLAGMISDLGELALDRARKLADELFRDMQNEYDELTSDESIIETLKINEYEFEMNSTKQR